MAGLLPVDICVKKLKERANSYHRDSQAARDLGDYQAFGMYLTISDELNKVIEFVLHEVEALDAEPVASYSDFCACTHHRSAHIYEEGACRPAGVVCKCEAFNDFRKAAS